MTRPIIIGNWKMNTTRIEAQELAHAVTNSLSAIETAEVVLCPPFIHLNLVQTIVHNTNLKLGAQNVHQSLTGAFTGEISPLMLAEVCEYVIVGHSERRTFFNESDELINQKMISSIQAGLKVILCVGESEEERNAGQTEPVLTRQIERGAANASDPSKLLIAYEPLWAIGSGISATPDVAKATMDSVIRPALHRNFGGASASMISLLYGGSVTPTNISEFLQNGYIQGALVGGASLKAESFIEIVRQTQ